MSTKGIGLVVALTAALLLAAPSTLAQKPSRLLITVVQGANRDPVRGARITLFATAITSDRKSVSQGIKRILEPKSGRVEDLAHSGLKLPAGKAIVQVSVGRYEVKATHSNQAANPQVVDVPGDGSDVRCVIKMRPLSEKESRRIIVAVSSDRDRKPLARATVEATTNAISLGTRQTDSKGEASWVIPNASFGDTVFLTVHAVGFAGNQSKIILGATPGDTNRARDKSKTPTDRVLIFLKRPTR